MVEITNGEVLKCPINFLYQSELIALALVQIRTLYDTRAPHLKCLLLRYAVADDPKCLPVKVDHKAILLISCNALKTKGLRFFKLWVGLFLNLGL